MKTKINTQEVGLYRIRIDYIKLEHEGVQVLIKYTMQFQQHLHIRFTLKVPPSCLTDPILYYCYIFSLHSMVIMKTQGLYL